MDAQAQTVTSITAAVDETALAADSMSSTIASIRNDSGMVAGEISVLSEKFAKMGERLQSLERAASEFRSEEHTSELQSLMRISYAVFCLKKKTQKQNNYHTIHKK